MKDETTVKLEESLSDINVHVFDEIQLVSRFSGAAGAVLFTRPRRGFAQLAPLRRLLVIVDDEQNGQTAERVSAVLGVQQGQLTRTVANACGRAQPVADRDQSSRPGK